MDGKYVAKTEGNGKAAVIDIVTDYRRYMRLSLPTAVI